MELIDFREIDSVEEYKEYLRQRSRLWYQRNREKKIKYQTERYYNMKNNKEQND